MPDASFLGWPFFEDRHRVLAASLDAWAAREIAPLAEDHGDVDARCRKLVALLGRDGWLGHAVPEQGPLDVRSLCLVREILARHSGLADFAFAMQGLGTGSIQLSGSDALKARYLPPVRRGERIAAFALSEPDAGSDVAAMSMSARRDGDDWVLDGTKTWISNGGIADHYVVFARSDPEADTRGMSAFVVDAGAPGLAIVERIETIAPHPLATLGFTQCRVPGANLLGRPGEGFRIAMATLDIFRSTVGAAALGFARRALDETLARARSRKMFGGVLADLPLAQASLAEMAGKG